MRSVCTAHDRILYTKHITISSMVYSMLLELPAWVCLGYYTTSDILLGVIGVIMSCACLNHSPLYLHSLSSKLLLCIAKTIHCWTKLVLMVTYETTNSVKSIPFKYLLFVCGMQTLAVNATVWLGVAICTLKSLFRIRKLTGDMYK